MTALTPENRFRVSRQLGHNAVMVITADGGELVALGKGIGFSHKKGQTIAVADAERWFTPSTAVPSDALAAMIADLPYEMLQIGAEIIDLAVSRLGAGIAPSAAVALADHLAQAVTRNHAGERAQPHPLAWEVRQLYTAEYEVAEAALGFVAERTGARLDESEAVAIALHLVNARFQDPSLEQALRMTTLIPALLQAVETATGLHLERSSMSVTRFVTHLRYLFVRLERGIRLDSLGGALTSMIPEAHPRAYQVALRLQYLLQSRWGGELSSDETAYLTLHVARLLQEAGPNRSSRNS